MIWLGLAGPLSLLIMFLVLAKLSERFGSVVKLSAHYRYYYVGLAFLILAIIAQMVVIEAKTDPGPRLEWALSPAFIVAAYHLPLAIGVSIGLAVTLYYWSWLITDRHD